MSTVGGAIAHWWRRECVEIKRKQHQPPELSVITTAAAGRVASGQRSQAFNNCSALQCCAAKSHTLTHTHTHTAPCATVFVPWLLQINNVTRAHARCALFSFSLWSLSLSLSDSGSACVLVVARGRVPSDGRPLPPSGRLRVQGGVFCLSLGLFPPCVNFFHIWFWCVLFFESSRALNAPREHQRRAGGRAPAFAQWNGRSWQGGEGLACWMAGCCVHVFDVFANFYDPCASLSRSPSHSLWHGENRQRAPSCFYNVCFLLCCERPWWADAAHLDARCWAGLFWFGAPLRARSRLVTACKVNVNVLFTCKEGIWYFHMIL